MSKTYELHITDEATGSGEIEEVYASSAAQAIRYYARDWDTVPCGLVTTETEGRSIETIVTDKNVVLVYAEAEVAGKTVQAGLEVQDLRRYE